MIASATSVRVTGVLALIAAEAFLYGFSYPYFSLALDARSVPLWLVGLNASTAGLGILLVGPFLPWIIERLGLRPLVVMQFSVSLACFAVLLTTGNLIVWFASRFVMGACFASLWTTTELWLNGIAPAAQRGRIVGASGTLYAACQFAGPLALGQCGAIGATPIITAMLPLALGIAVAMAIPPALGRVEEEEPDGTFAALRAALPIAGPLMWVALLTGIGETAMQSLLPLYGRRHGLSVMSASVLIAVFSLGEAVLVAVLGWLADRHGSRGTLLLAAAVAAVSSAMIPVFVHNVLPLWVVLFLAGGTIAGLYTLGVVQIGQMFTGQKLVLVSTGFAMAYSAGSVLGATPMGAAMDQFGVNTLPILTALLFAGLFAALQRSSPRALRSGARSSKAEGVAMSSIESSNSIPELAPRSPL
jgi:MFS family permease